MGVDWFAMLFGLGFVLSFGYWCTNFLVVQRAMAAKNMSAARRTPLIAALPKMIFPILVILPGMIAAGLAVTPKHGYRFPPKPLTSAEYAKAEPALKAAATMDAKTAFESISEATGAKMSPQKVAALIKDARIGNRARENDWVSGSRDDSGARNDGRSLVRLALAHAATLTGIALDVKYSRH